MKVGEDKTRGGAAKTAGREPGSSTAASETVGKRGAVTGDSEEEEGPVGPQVVKAFINYFSKEVGKRKRVNSFGVKKLLCSTKIEEMKTARDNT